MPLLVIAIVVQAVLLAFCVTAARPAKRSLRDITVALLAFS